MTTCDPVAEAEIRRELAPEERLLWFARPRQGIRFHAADLILVPFSLLWTGFAIVWEAIVIAIDAPMIFWLWGVPFVLVGAYVTVGRFIVDAMSRRRTAYGLTDQRVLVASGLRTRRVRSLDLAALADLSLTERADRSGSITFGGIYPRRQRRTGAALPGIPSPFAFEMIEEVRGVYDQIRAAQEERRVR